MGMGYLLADTMQFKEKMGGWQLFDIYIALAVMLHASVGIQRTWDFNMQYTIGSGKWYFFLTGFTILLGLIKHMVDFRFNELFHAEDSPLYVKTLPMYVPKYAMQLNLKQPPFIFTYATKEQDGILAQVRDVFTPAYIMWQDPVYVFQYAIFVGALVAHLWRVWPKIVGAGHFQIPQGHQERVKKIGLLAAAVCGTLYFSVPLRIYLGLIHPEDPFTGKVGSFP
jgi:hypothetical protein